jgi:L-lactate dehydrogenase complex protein LldF
MAPATREVIEEFKKRAAKANAIVFEATNAGATSDYVFELVQKHNVKQVVKAKSALFEKLDLRKQLEKAGLEVKETDVESWIAQLAGEKPHVTIEEVATLISKASGEEVNPDPLALIKAARRELRQLYLDADLGISEADLAIAESGSVVVMENEGNGRLVSLLPRIHLTIVNTENLVSTVKDATSRIKSRRQSATVPGDPRYVTYISGRSSTGDIPKARGIRAQGPEEEYILIVNQS